MLARHPWISDISVKNSRFRESRIGNPNWRTNGLWTGKCGSTLREFPAPVYRPLINQRTRDALVKLTAGWMSSWLASPWEREGEARQSLRCHFINDGHDWHLSDLEAARVIEAAFKFSGHEDRPSWWQGQPEVLRSDKLCLQCGGNLKPIPGQGVTAFFCDEVCCDKYNLRREERFNISRTSDAMRLYRELKLSKIPTRDCECCGNSFKPAEKGARFCSPACYGMAARTVDERDCPYCGKRFKPVAAKGKHCSTACALASRTHIPNIPCIRCGTLFKAYKQTKRWCSPECAIADKAQPPRPCKTCGTLFKYRAGREFCSQPCYRAAPLPSKTCVVCSINFTPKSGSAKTCSPTCSTLKQKRDRKARDRMREAFTCQKC